MSKYKIGVIGLKGLPPTGGGARAGWEVTRRLAHKYEFTVFAMSSHASDRLPIPGVRQVIVPSVPFRQANLILYYWASSIAAVLKHNFDLVHVVHGMGGYVLPLLRSRFPTLVTFQGNWRGIALDERFGWFARNSLRFGESLAIRLGNELVTVAAGHVSYYESLTSKRVDWIPNGVNPASLEACVEGDADYGEDIVFAAGRIIPLKGCDVLLEAMKLLPTARRLVVIGDMSVSPAYAARLRELSNDLEVEFLGMVEDPTRLARLIRGAALFVFPSLTEAMSNMLLEAVTYGVPIVCSDIPANRSLLKDNETTFVRTGSVHDLAARLEWALEHLSEMRKRTDLAKRRIEREYNWDNIAVRYGDLYEGLIRRSTTPVLDSRH